MGLFMKEKKKEDEREKICVWEERRERKGELPILGEVILGSFGIEIQIRSNKEVHDDSLYATRGIADVFCGRQKSDHWTPVKLAKFWRGDFQARRAWSLEDALGILIHHVFLFFN